MDSLEIYSEMFPKIDREVIKLILQELNSDEILDALINISTDSSLSQQTAILISEQLRSPNPESYSAPPERVEIEETSSYIPEYHPMLSENDLEEQSSGFFNRLFRRRRDAEARYNPDDDL